jgi:hypothetical protein
METQISEDAQAALFALEDLGPFAVFDQLDALQKRLPPPASMYLSGYLAALRPEPHPLDLARMQDRNFADGYAAGMEITAARQKMDVENV